jgi:predicted nuclease of predicted toxin-antitoxin system
VKFLIDMPLSPAVAAWLADQGHDAVHASDLGLHRATDSEIIDRARGDARTIVTADLDYPRLLAVARATEPSLILFRNGDWTEGEVRRRLSDILGTLTEGDIACSIITVDRDRVRRRRLPIR